MAKTVSFKRLILRTVLRQVSPMVIRLVSVSDHMPLPEFHDVFRIILGWNGDLGYIIRVHGQEFNSFQRKMRSKALHEFKLHRQEKFLYVCDTLHMWEWDVRVLDIQDGSKLSSKKRTKGIGYLRIAAANTPAKVIHVVIVPKMAIGLKAQAIPCRRIIIVPFPDTIENLVMYLHECGYLAKTYDKSQVWLEEVEAEFFMLQVIVRSKKNPFARTVSSRKRGSVLI